MLQAGRDGAFGWLPQLIDDSVVPNEVAYFWLTGLLSAFLDNAPTYLVFFELAGGDAQTLMTSLAPTLAAISMGAVYMGALTYIGNAPNLMIYAIAEERGVRMPSFFGYLLWASLILLPGLLLITYLFLCVLALRDARLAPRGLALARAAFAGSATTTSTSSSAPSRAKLRAAERGRGRQRGGVEIAGAHLAQHRQIRDVGEVAVDLDHVLEARAHRRQRRLQILEHLQRLGAEIAADEIAVAAGRELARDVDRPAGAGHLHHLRVGRRFGQRVGIDEADIGHREPPRFSVCGLLCISRRGFPPAA